jgi:predicted GNAT family N-acyltransferase
MNSDFIKIIKPQTLQEFEAYYFLRYKILRKPWNRELGSEKDDQEADSIHAMACNQDNLVLGVCRLQLNSTHEAQIRYMAVEENVQGFGIGRKLMEFMEKEAIKINASKIILHSRASANNFYEKCGYVVVEKSYLMWGEIQHYLMEKEIKKSDF